MLDLTPSSMSSHHDIVMTLVDNWYLFTSHEFTHDWRRMLVLYLQKNGCDQLLKINIEHKVALSVGFEPTMFRLEQSPL